MPHAAATLDDALDLMSRLRGWRVMPRDRARAGTPYEGWLRLRLDTAQLPRPFQITAITNRDWNLQAEWTRLRFVP